MKQVKSSHVRKHLAKVFGGIVDSLEIVEADFKMIVTPSEKHMRDGKPGDPFSCPLSLANREQHGCTITATYNTSAYMDLVDTHGKRRIHRFLVPRATGEAIRQVDAEKAAAAAGRSYFFNPVTPSTTLAAAYKRGAKSNTRRNQKARATVVKAGSYERTARRAALAAQGAEERLKALKLAEKPGSSRVKDAQKLAKAATARAAKAQDKASEWRTKADAVKVHAHVISKPKNMVRAGAWARVPGDTAPAPHSETSNTF